MPAAVIPSPDAANWQAATNSRLPRMTSSSSPTLYDEIPYPGGVFPSTHPEHLATIASLYGMNPVPVDRCRVLELGCGFGANLLPMAYHYPQAKFLGIDLSATSIARGQHSLT